MKRLLFILTGLILMQALPCACLYAQDKENEKKFHIKIEKTEDGRKITLDTVLTSDEPFAWQGDTIMSGCSDGDGAGSLKFTDHIYVLRDKEGMPDSLEESLKNRYKEMDENIMIFKFPADGDSPEPDRWYFNHNFDFPGKGSRVIVKEKKNSGNVIDLSDPDIISYKKKTLRDGTEKITIVRKKKPRKTQKINKVIIKGATDLKSGGGKVRRIEEEVEAKERQKDDQAPEVH